MKVDGVFSGGGIKAYAFIGSLQSIYEHDLEFSRVAGTSAGAIIASFLASGYKLNELEKTLETFEPELFLDPPLLSRTIPGFKWLFLYFQMGLYQGRKFEAWLYDRLAEKNVYTFGDLPPEGLKVVVSDLSLGKMVVIPDDLETVYHINPQLFSVAKAVRMSAGFPYFFMPKRLPGQPKDKSIIVDGGLLSNFPLWIFEKERSQHLRPILGVKLSESTEHAQPRTIKNALDMFRALFTTMQQAHDSRYISKSDQNNIIFIPVKQVATMDFKLKSSEREKLIKLGKESTDQFLKGWPN